MLTKTTQAPSINPCTRCRQMLLLALLVLCHSVMAQVMLPYQNPSLSFHERATDLVSRLTLAEKASQMGNYVTANIHRADRTQSDARVKLPAYQYWNEALHGVARSGAATSFPVSKAMSASWDRQLVRECADAISTEARVYNNTKGKGLNYWCPTINMSRDPRWGRDEENYGEDPFLCGQLAVEFIRGMQGEPDAANPYLKTVACAKHFAANNYEAGRQGSTSFMAEHNLRQYYLPAFEMAVRDGGVRSLMSSYNALSIDINEKNAAGINWQLSDARGKIWGGKPNAMNDWLLTDILRSEWGFDGYVTSDCAGVSSIYRAVKHFYFGNTLGTYTDEAGAINDKYKALSTAYAIKAGNDINCEFMSTTAVYQSAVEQAIADGYMTEADLNRALIRVLETRFALGEFDDDCPWRSIPASRLECDEHQQLALKAARESIVLLKNEVPEGDSAPLLPLSADRKVALIGPYANQIMLGDYSGTPSHTTTPFQAFASKLDFHVSDGTVQAESFSEAVVSKRGATNNNKGAGCLENTSPGDIFLYRDVDFGDGCTLFEMSCASKNTGVGRVSFLLDDKDAEPFLTVDNVDTGNWTKWTTVTASLDPTRVRGRHDLYVRLSGSNSYVGNYDYFKFYNPAANPMETTGPLYMVETSGSVNTRATQEAIDRAVAVARRADVVIFLGGTNFEKPDDHATGTESHDRWVLTLPGNQEDVLKAVYAVNKNVVLVLETNSSVDITWEKEHLPAILDAWYGGQAQGQAICDVVYGDYNPSGKLTSTWYNSVAELPSERDSRFKSNGMLEYNIDDWGYTYMYYGRGTGANVARQAQKPMYPFGYGQSYTTFEYSDAAISRTSATCTVTNTGTRQGAEVVQVYASFPGSAVAHRPTRKLIGFDRVELAPGERKTVTIPIADRELAYYDDNSHSWQVEAGTVSISISASSDDHRLSGSFTTEAYRLADTYLSNPTLTAIHAVEHANAHQSTTDVTDHCDIYDVYGRKIDGVALTHAGLHRGLYIVNGKKMIR